MLWERAHPIFFSLHRRYYCYYASLCISDRFSHFKCFVHCLCAMFRVCVCVCVYDYDSLNGERLSNFPHSFCFGSVIYTRPHDAFKVVHWFKFPCQNDRNSFLFIDTVRYHWYFSINQFASNKIAVYFIAFFVVSLLLFLPKKE